MTKQIVRLTKEAVASREAFTTMLKSLRIILPLQITDIFGQPTEGEYKNETDNCWQKYSKEGMSLILPVADLDEARNLKKALAPYLPQSSQSGSLLKISQEVFSQLLQAAKSNTQKYRGQDAPRDSYHSAVDYLQTTKTNIELEENIFLREDKVEAFFIKVPEGYKVIFSGDTTANNGEQVYEKDFVVVRDKKSGEDDYRGQEYDYAKLNLPNFNELIENGLSVEVLAQQSPSNTATATSGDGLVIKTRAFTI